MNDLNPGDVICEKCNGTGFEKNPDIWQGPCDVCRGSGKLDWIEAVVGKAQPKPNHITATFDLSKFDTGMSFSDPIIKAMVENMAKQIDEDILKSIIGDINGSKNK